MSWVNDEAEPCLTLSGILKQRKCTKQSIESLLKTIMNELKKKLETSMIARKARDTHIVLVLKRERIVSKVK